MANGTVETILGLPVGGFLRTSAGFFQRLPDGRIAFLPSIFRMPWHSKTPRIVDRPGIERLLRMESIEMTIAILMLLLAVHYYFLDILDFYLSALNLPMAIIAHTVSTVLSVILILYINNAPFSWLRARMAAAMPIAEGAFAAADFDTWQGPQKLWRLSLVTNENAASLRKGVVLLYLVLMMCSLPLLLAIIPVIRLRQYEGNGQFGLYCRIRVLRHAVFLGVFRKRARPAQTLARRPDPPPAPHASRITGRTPLTASGSEIQTAG